MDDKTLRLGTRGSPLALWQAKWVAARLGELGAQVELVLITTGGDVTSQPISATGEQGLFTKEIQRALLDDRADLAVHSLKDLPTESVAGLMLASVPRRAAPGDVLVSNVASSLDELTAGARIGTGSRRRQSQLLHARSDLQVEEIRGNVDTRLRKLDEGQYDGILLAEAGLRRLGLENRITQQIPLNVMLPAIGQGALGIESRENDLTTLAAVAQLDDAHSHQAVSAERAMLSELRGGCLAPVGAWGRVEQETLVLDGVVLSMDGTIRLEARVEGAPEQADLLGRQAAQDLLASGAAELIAGSRGQDG